MDIIPAIDDIAFTLLCGPVVAVVICGMLLLMSKSKCGTESPVSKTDSYETTILKLVEPSENKNRQFSTAKGKHHKLSSANRQQQQQQQQQQNLKNKAASTIVVENWLQSDLYCYDRRSSSSCFEANTATYQIIQRRNSTPSVPTGGENLNFSSSNDDLSLPYLEKETQSNNVQSRKKRKEKRKRHQSKTLKNSNNIQPRKSVEEIKENIKTTGTKNKSNTCINLRKQCTKAAALKFSPPNKSEIAKTFNKDKKSNLATNLCVKSSLLSSAASSTSTTSISSSISSLSSSALSSPTNSPTQSVNSSPTASPKPATPALRQFTKLNMNELQLYQQLQRYIIDPSHLRIYGFPVESVLYEGCVELYRCLPKHLAEETITQDNQRHHRHFYGRKKLNLYTTSYHSRQNWYGNSLAVDSGQSSADSSPRSTDSDSSEVSEEDAITPIVAFYTPDGVYQIFSEYCNSMEKQCVRCSQIFEIDERGDYLTFDSCTYHWGKLSNVYDSKCNVNIYSCCQRSEFSEGCSIHPLHVWNGVVVGVNGPYTGFVHTQHKQQRNKRIQSKIYAIDCEMCYTGLGLEVTKVTVVGFNGQVVYDHFVLPLAKVVDYNTRYSGVSEQDFLHSTNSFCTVKTFAEVQSDLLNLFDSNTILIGHGLENDLKVLRLVHKKVVDTSVVFRHSTGYPYRRSLKILTKSFLKRDIQCSHLGHSSFEDSVACLELMLWKIRNDLQHYQ